MTETAVIEGLKLIYQTGGVNRPDDESYPFVLELKCRPPGFMDFTFVMLYGGEERAVVLGQTQEALLEFIECNRLERHPRLRSLTITARGAAEPCYQRPLPEVPCASSS